LKGTSVFWNEAAPEFESSILKVSLDPESLVWGLMRRRKDNLGKGQRLKLLYLKNAGEMGVNVCLNLKNNED
jgi:hypothetical protein